MEHETTKGTDCAFPIEAEGYVKPEFGLTKREYFAVKIAAGLAVYGGYDKFESLAMDSVEVADALISVLNKEP